MTDWGTKKAYDYIINNEIDKAWFLLKKVDNDQANYMKGVLCEENQRFGGQMKAIEFYKKVTGIANAFHNHGTILLTQDQYNEAIPLFLKAIELDPKHTKAMNNLAICYELLKDPDQKQYDYFKKIAEIDPANSYAHHNIGYINSGRGNVDIAQEHLEIAYQLNNKYPETCYTLGVLYNGYTLNKPLIKEAELLFQECHQAYAEQTKQKLLYLQCQDGPTMFSFNNAILSSGHLRVRTDDGTAIIVSHHDLHIPIHRWNPSTNIIKLTNAWSTLQHNSWGFYHWICETLPKIFMILEQDMNMPIIVPDKGFVRDALKNIKGNFVYCSPNDTYQIDDIKIIDWPSVQEPSPKSKEFLIPNYIVDLLRRSFNKWYSPCEPSNKQKIIWLSRCNVKGVRDVTNEDQVVDAIFNTVSQYTEYEFVRYIPEDYPFDDMRDVFYNAKMIIGVHGGAFSNMLFSNKCTIIEFSMMEDYYRYYFKCLAESCGHQYYNIDFDIPNIFKKSFEINEFQIEKMIYVINECLKN